MVSNQVLTTSELKDYKCLICLSIPDQPATHVDYCDGLYCVSCFSQTTICSGCRGL